MAVEPAAVPCSLGCSQPKSLPGCLTAGPWRLQPQLPGKSRLASMAATAVVGSVVDFARQVIAAATATTS